MKTKTIGSMMAAASLFAVTACGSVLAPTGGDDTGSGSGSQEAPVSCASASDCIDGTACDLEAKQCVSDALTIDNTDLVSDGLRYWTATSGPKLVGSYQGSADAVVQVKVGSGAAIAATTDGSRWTVQLAAGTILETDTLVSVTLTDPGQGVVELEGVFAMDGAAPTISLGASKVRDERGDAITFSDQGPLHDHQGAEIDLAAPGCTNVYKHSYLMDTAAPAYGSEVTPNPIRWDVSVQDTKVASVEVSIRDASNVVYRDWTPITGSGTSYPIVLNRDGDLGVGDRAKEASQYEVHVRARDWGNRESTTKYCIHLVPLAAPLKFEQTKTPTDGLSGWTLQANSPISRVANAGAGAAIAEQVITQYSSEPVAVSFFAPPLAGTWRVQQANGWVATSTTRVSIPCSWVATSTTRVSIPCSSSFDCSPAIGPSWSTTSGALTQYDRTAVLLDGAGNPVPAGLGGYLIPGRAAGAPPAVFRLRVTIARVAHFGSDGLHPYDERTDGSLVYTGSPATNTTEACTSRDVLGTSCARMTTFKWLRAVKTIGLTVNTFEIPLTVAATQGGAFTEPPGVSRTLFFAPTVNWDGGSEDTLGGP